MDNYLGYRVVALAVLTGLNAFFSAAEVALLSVRPEKMQALARRGNRGAQAAVSLITNMERMLSLCQAGITLASLGMGWAGEQAIHDQITRTLSPLLPAHLDWLVHGISFAFAFLFLTLVIVVIGEVVPKNLAVEKAERMAIVTAPALLFFYRLMTPFVFIIERGSIWISRLIGLKGMQAGGGHSAEEIKHIIAASGEKGHLPEFEESAIHRLLDLRLVIAREIMVPRADIVSVPLEADLDDVLRVFSETHYSRLAVHDGSPDKLVGLVHSRDLIRVWRERRFANERRKTTRPFRLSDWMRKPIVVPETRPVNELIDVFRTSHTHMGVVVDEFGSVSGILTLEDVLEQVFGEIEDEHDARQERQPDDDTSDVEVDGTIPILDLETQYGIDLPSDAGFQTLAGFLLSRLGFIPKGGEVVSESGRRYTVLQMDRNRIARVRIERIQSAPAEPEEDPKQ